MNETIDQARIRCIENLNSIRRVIDTDVMNQSIEEQKNKLVMLTQLTGLAAEAKALAHKTLSRKELEVLKAHKDESIPAS
ncbi:MAG: hypothetical protein K2X86_08855, partial [Cytophagaceae bacterium]|nr:hypothetical protein [Cytophagaceae bacterium]